MPLEPDDPAYLLDMLTAAEAVMRVATVHIPELVKLLHPLIPPPPADPDSSQGT